MDGIFKISISETISISFTIDCFFYFNLHFSFDLYLNLYLYCYENGKIVMDSADGGKGGATAGI